jgi:hypothetical protein
MLFPQGLWRLLNVSLSLPVRPGFRMERAAPSPARRRPVVATLNEWLHRVRS